MATKIRINNEWVTLLTSAESSITGRMAIMEQRLDELTRIIESLQQDIAPSTNVKSVKSKEKSDLEILNTIDDNSFIDLEKINETKLWEPYDEDWWNK